MKVRLACESLRTSIPSRLPQIAALCLIFFLCLLRAAAAPAQVTETTLYSFPGNSGGAYGSGMILDSAGNLYGSAFYGGNMNDCTENGGSGGCGLVYELSPPSGGTGSWTETVLYAFTGESDGGLPGQGNLVFDTQGNLYGTTEYRGDNSCNMQEFDDAFGCGVVFKLTPPASGSGPWTETVLHIFDDVDSIDGALPTGSLVFDAQGNLYGTTTQGGAYNRGTIYELSPYGDGWNYTLLYSFGSYSTDGLAPQGLVLDSQGNLYGATAGGGSITMCGDEAGCGTVFELSPPASGVGPWTETILYNFSNGFDGGLPSASLVWDAQGNLCGTASSGGIKNCGGYDCGVVFKVSAPAGGSGTWTEATLHAFVGDQNGATDGSVYGSPFPLILDSHGNLFGAAQADYGDAFELALPGSGSGQWNITYLFQSAECGADSNYSLTLDSQHNLYGAGSPGSYDAGCVFELSGNPASSTMSLALSPTTVTVGSAGPVVIAATVAPTSGSGSPPGSVSFFNASNFLGVWAVSGGGATISYDTSELLPGAYTISGYYIGTGGYTGSTAGQTLNVVCCGTTATTLAISPSDIPTGGGPVTMTASVSSTIATGAVAFFNGPQQVGTAALSSGKATFSYTASALPLGTYSLTAVYGGDANFGGSAAPAQALIVTGDGATTTSLYLSPSTAVTGSPVAMTATVAPAAATGLVDFYNGTLLGSVTLNGRGEATFIYNSANGGGQIQATYVGDANYASSTSSAETLTVTGCCATTATVLTLSPAYETVGSSGPVVMSGKVSYAPASGTITFYNGTQLIGNGSTTQAFSYDPSSLTVGTYSITGVYPGNSEYDGSTSAPVTLTIGTLGTTTTTVSGSDSASSYGQELTFKATVDAVTAPQVGRMRGVRTRRGGPLASPTGTVSFLANGASIGCNAVTLSGGTATCTTTLVRVGSNAITARYSGDSNYADSASTAFTQSVNPVELTVTAGNLSMNEGNPLPALKYTITGFVNGDTQAGATTGAPLLTTTATSGSPPGTYPIAAGPGTLAAASYTFTMVNGAMTVDATSLAINLSPSPYGFTPAQAVGTTSSPETITVTNLGTSALTVSSISVVGTNPGDFPISTTCPLSPSTLAAGKTCTVTVSFKPAAKGPRRAAISAASTAPGSPTLDWVTGVGK
jgi:uncharacterized repeat protein (TIGR03803 family)